MPFVLTVLVVAVVVSYLRGGRLSRFAEAPLRWPWLLFLGVVVQVGVDVAAARELLPDAGVSGWLLLFASQLLVVAWVAANWQLPGMVLVTLGLALNAIVIAANGAMPVSADAIAAIGVQDATLTGGKHTLLTGSSRLWWLADIWPLPPLRSIISIGDVVLAAGVIPVTHSLMTYRPPAERRRRHTTEADAVEPPATEDVDGAGRSGRASNTLHLLGDGPEVAQRRGVVDPTIDLVPRGDVDATIDLAEQRDADATIDLADLDDRPVT